MPLPTDRSNTSTSYEHITDHNTLHAAYNDFEENGGGGADIPYQTTAPSTPSTGDLWVDSDEAAQSGTTVSQELILRRVAAQTINNATQTDISWDTEVTDTGGLITVPSTVITIPAGKGGIWTCTVTGAFSATVGTGRAFVNVYAGGQFYRAAVDNEDWGTAGFAGIRLADGATIETSLFQSSGSSKTWTGRIEMYRIAA